MAHSVEIEKKPKNFQSPNGLSSIVTFVSTDKSVDFSIGSSHVKVCCQIGEGLDVDMILFNGTKEFNEFHRIYETAVKAGLSCQTMPNIKEENKVVSAIRKFTLGLVIQQNSKSLEHAIHAAYQNGIAEGRRQKVKEFQDLLEV